MREVPVVNVDRLRDGGTTYIETTEGTLFSPSPMRQMGPPTWKETIRLKPLDLDSYAIIERPAITIERKTA